MKRGRLVVMRTAGSDLKQTADIEVGRHSAHVMIDAQSKRAYATNSADNTISVVDLASKRKTYQVATGAFPHGLRTSPDGREICVACVNARSV